MAERFRPPPTSPWLGSGCLRSPPPAPVAPQIQNNPTASGNTNTHDHDTADTTDTDSDRGAGFGRTTIPIPDNGDSDTSVSDSASVASSPPMSPPPATPVSVGIGQYVRRVYVQTGTLDEDEQAVPRDGELSLDLLARFPNAEQFDLVNVRWDGLQGDVQAYFADTHAGMITSLTLRDVVFPTLRALGGLVRGLHSLQALRLRNVVWESEGEEEEGEPPVPQARARGQNQGPAATSRDPHPHRSSAGAAPAPGASSSSGNGGGGGGGGDGNNTMPQGGVVPHLEELEIYECTSPGAFISHLFTFVPHTTAASSSSSARRERRDAVTGERLQRLALDWRGRELVEEDPAILRNLILDAGAALQILEVDLAWQRVYPTSSPPSLLHPSSETSTEYSHLQSLRSRWTCI